MADEIAIAPNAITKFGESNTADITAPTPASAETNAVQTRFLGIGYNLSIRASSTH